ncbi:hypothetical protein EUX98_g5785 [Antrodiella citrinella]|uniref:Uncharacterized protein n=1 Tax=Antrodiella citrinella TaxID=2447956 RepID=A0A4S4MRK8_9APHY|nr:hypothetical protein EUX98_g5785 [Antrodiella citrinella]
MFAEVLEFEICDVFFSFDTAGLFYPDATFDSLYYASYWDDPANALTAASNITGTSHVERFSAKLKVMAANEDVLEILRLSTKVGHHLTHLHVSLEYYPRRWDDEADYFGVSQCTRLSTFHITVYAALHNVEFQLPFVCDDVTNIVFHLPTSISKFKIELICETSYEADVKVEFTNRYNDDGVNFNTEIELAKEFLPRLRDLNVLTVCGPDEEVTS